MNALMNGALVSSGFQPLTIFFADLQSRWKSDGSSKRTDSPDRFLNHLLDNVDLSTPQIELMTIRD